MKSNRRLADLKPLIEKYGLSSAKPPPDSIFWEMWNTPAAQAIAKATLALPYLQGINTGLLNPNYYGGYNVADAYYCFNGADDYKEAASRAPNGSGLQAFLLKKMHGYQAYNATFPDTWHVANAADITPPQITIDYSTYEKNVVTHMDPIYAIIVMLPCEYLWAWLASQMNTPTAQNVYGEWITGNNDPSGAYTMGNFLDAYIQENPGSVDVATANSVYVWAQFFEYANFSGATNAAIFSSIEMKLPKQPAFQTLIDA